MFPKYDFPNNLSQQFYFPKASLAKLHFPFYLFGQIIISQNFTLSRFYLANVYKANVLFCHKLFSKQIFPKLATLQAELIAKVW